MSRRRIIFKENKKVLYVRLAYLYLPEIKFVAENKKLVKKLVHS